MHAGMKFNLWTRARPKPIRLPFLTQSARTSQYKFCIRCVCVCVFIWDYFVKFSIMLLEYISPSMQMLKAIRLHASATLPKGGELRGHQRLLFPRAGQPAGRIAFINICNLKHKTPIPRRKATDAFLHRKTEGGAGGGRGIGSGVLKLLHNNRFRRQNKTKKMTKTCQDFNL